MDHDKNAYTIDVAFGMRTKIWDERQAEIDKFPGETKEDRFVNWYAAACRGGIPDGEPMRFGVDYDFEIDPERNA